MKEGNGVPSVKKSSTLTVTPEQKAERKELNTKITRGLPIAVLLALAVNSLTDGAVGNINLDIASKAPGVAEARALRERNAQRSADFYENLRASD